MLGFALGDTFCLKKEESKLVIAIAAMFVCNVEIMFDP